MFDKAQLIERGRHYFDDSKTDKMYATTDGNFFYEQDKSYADSHAKGLKTSVIEITRGDLAEKKAAPKVEPKTPDPSIKSTDNGSGSSLDVLRAEAKKLKIKGWAIMKEGTLKKKIEDATT